MSTTSNPSTANATTVAPPFEVYQDSLSQRTSDALAAGHVPSNDPTREARPDGEKQDVREPSEMTEADRTRLDPLSHRPEGGEWEKGQGGDTEGGRRERAGGGRGGKVIVVIL